MDSIKKEISINTVVRTIDRPTRTLIWLFKMLYDLSSDQLFNPKKIIDIEILKKWYYNFPPKHDELYHNMVVKRIQNKNNIFISNYNKKNKGVKKIFETL